MRVRKSHFMAGVIAVACLVQPRVSLAQECALRLSAFEAATEDFGAEVSVLATNLARGFTRFDGLDAQATAEPEACPSGIAQSRDAVRDLQTRSFVEDGDVLLDCGQFFSARVLADIDAAKAANDSQLLLRLGEIQARILAVQSRATQTAIEATFLELRAQRLVGEHGALERRCTMLSDIYD